MPTSGFQCREVIENSLQVSRQLINDVDLHLLMHNAYGKGLMKKCKLSPDAFIQMALQLAYYRVSRTHCFSTVSVKIVDFFFVFVFFSKSRNRL